MFLEVFFLRHSFQYFEAIAKHITMAFDPFTFEITPDPQIALTGRNSIQDHFPFFWSRRRSGSAHRRSRCRVTFLIAWACSLCTT